MNAKSVRREKFFCTTSCSWEYTSLSNPNVDVRARRHPHIDFPESASQGFDWCVLCMRFAPIPRVSAASKIGSDFALRLALM